MLFTLGSCLLVTSMYLNTPLALAIICNMLGCDACRVVTSLTDACSGSSDNPCSFSFTLNLGGAPTCVCTLDTFMHGSGQASEYCPMHTRVLCKHIHLHSRTCVRVHILHMYMYIAHCTHVFIFFACMCSKGVTLGQSAPPPFFLLLRHLRVFFFWTYSENGELASSFAGLPRGPSHAKKRGRRRF